MSFPKQTRNINDMILDKRRREPCWVCGLPAPSDPSHIKTQGSGGPDALWNVVAKCRVHHTEWGWSAIKMLKKYPSFALRLKILGWDWSSGKLTHPSLDQC